MKPTVGRVHSLQALEIPQACALPSGVTTKGYRITNENLALLKRHGLIQMLKLTAEALKKHRILFVYTITDAGREWLDIALTEKGFK